jgi:hypothetical protein
MARQLGFDQCLRRDVPLPGDISLQVKLDPVLSQVLPNFLNQLAGKLSWSF